jgi:hypothetical protein
MQVYSSPDIWVRNKKDETCVSGSTHERDDKLIWKFRPEVKRPLTRILRVFIYRLFNDVI